MSWTETDVPDQTGRVAVVTGGNGGLGLENARVLATRGAHVVIGARNLDKGAAAEKSIRNQHANVSVDVRSLDLADLESVDRFGRSLLRDFEQIDILINNAGVMAIPERKTADGFEMQLGTNHLGHYALTAHLLPALVDTPDARVVAVTSTARHFGKPIDEDNPHLEGNYSKWTAYGNSKLANLHFALGLERRFRAAGAKAQSLVAHPGLTNTDLQANTARQGGGDISEQAASRVGMQAAEGALPQLRAATDPSARGGELYAPRWANWGPPVKRPLVGRSKNQDSIDTLFRVSERETGLALDVAAARTRS